MENKMKFLDIKKIGLPRLIIGGFFVVLLVAAAFLKIPMDTLFSDIIRRFAMNGVLVLAMVPTIQAGAGPNFALPIGVVCGLLGQMIAMEFNFMGLMCIIMAVVFSIIISVIVGYLYGKMLNGVAGAEMTIATYSGFAFVSLGCIAWMLLPFQNPNLGWFLGNGLRDSIQFEVWNCSQIFDNFLRITIGDFTIPTGLLLVFFGLCAIVWLFFNTKTGIAISACGMSNKFAATSGLNINRNKIFANILSTILGAIGIILYSQCFGYAQLYNAPLTMAFGAVAAVLIGGATAKRAKVSHVIIGTLLFQGMMTTALPVANAIFVGTDLSDTIRMIIQNGIILYALTQVKGGAK